MHETILFYPVVISLALLLIALTIYIMMTDIKKANKTHQTGPKIYISGKITGLPICQAGIKFQLAQMEIERLGGIAVNPMKEVKYVKGKTWESYMKADIALLLNCDAIFMLDNYFDSKGAMLEKSIARDLSIEVLCNTYDLKTYIESYHP